MNKYLAVLFLVGVVALFTGCNEQNILEKKDVQQQNLQQQDVVETEKVSESETDSAVDSDWSEESDDVEIGEMI